MVQDTRQAVQDTLAPETRERKARLDALESRMEHSEAAAEHRHSEVLNTIRDAVEVTHLASEVPASKLNANPSYGIRG